MEGAMRRIGIIAVEAMLVSIEGMAMSTKVAVPVAGDLAPVTGSFEVTCPRP
jgi:hypothetical protein